MSDALICQELSLDELTDIVGGTDKTPPPPKDTKMETIIVIALQSVVISSY